MGQVSLGIKKWKEATIALAFSPIQDKRQRVLSSARPGCSALSPAPVQAPSTPFYAEFTLFQNLSLDLQN
jgi:hypothetical protein